MEKIFGILACPAGHSLSPAMHLAGFRELSLPYGFEAWDVQPEELGSFMNALKARTTIELKAGEFDLSKAEGFSVSMPHKENIIPLLDSLDEVGGAVGAVSCVYMHDGKFIGTNLDYMGVKGSLLASSYVKAEGLKGKKVIVLGAGGAAKAAVFGLLQIEMIPIIFNRTIEKAKEIAEQFSTPDLQLEAYSLDDLESNFEDVEIIINCTSLGLGNDTQIVSDKVFSHIKLSLDAVYSHELTIFQTQALEKGNQGLGAENLTGLEWLLHQGYEAFRIWTGQEAPEQAMRDSLK